MTVAGTELGGGASLLLPDGDGDHSGGVKCDDGDDYSISDDGDDGGVGDVLPRTRIPASRCRPVLAMCLLGQTATTLENNYCYNCYGNYY